MYEKRKYVTIYGIAKRLKISPTPVSRGLQELPPDQQKTRKKIFDLANEIGYRTIE